MGRPLKHHLTYDAPLVDVAAMLADPSFREQVCAYQRVSRSHVEVEVDGDTLTVVIEQVQRARGIPSFAQKFVGDEIEIVQREDWTSLAAADLHVTVPHKPAEVEGTIRLVESDGTTTQTVDAEVSVRVPLVGGKIEDVIADLLRKALDAENVVGRDYLSG